MLHSYNIRQNGSARASQHEDGKAELRNQVQESLAAIQLYEQFRKEGMSPTQANRAAFYAQRGLK